MPNEPQLPEPNLQLCTYCGHATTRSSGICSVCINLIAGCGGEELLVTHLSEDEARKYAESQGRALGKRVIAGKTMTIYKTSGELPDPMDASTSAVSTSKSCKVLANCTLHYYDEPKCEPDTPLRTTAWERRNPNQPFYAAIANKKKRRR